MILETDDGIIHKNTNKLIESVERIEQYDNSLLNDNALFIWSIPYIQSLQFLLLL